MSDAIGRRDGGLRERRVSELNRVREDGCFGDFVDKMEAAVVLGRVSDVEAVAATEVPSGAWGGLVVDGHQGGRREWRCN